MAAQGKDTELERRRGLSFAQAEGVAQMPAQLKLKELSQELRAMLWAVVWGNMNDSIVRPNQYSSRTEIREPWREILRNKHLLRDHRMMDEFDDEAEHHVAEIKEIYEDGDYVQVLDFTQWLLEQGNLPDEFPEYIKAALAVGRAAYDVYDEIIIAPRVSEQEGKALSAALAATNKKGLEGPRAHLVAATAHLNAGRWPDSIRESIHAVEATAKNVAGSEKDSLKQALNQIAKTHSIHEGMLKGFTALYGFTSDEKGIRHALLDKGDANVDQIDAIYMLGACASFVSYLLARSRAKNS